MAKKRRAAFFRLGRDVPYLRGIARRYLGEFRSTTSDSHLCDSGDTANGKVSPSPSTKTAVIVAVQRVDLRRFSWR